MWAPLGGGGIKLNVWRIKCCLHNFTTLRRPKIEILLQMFPPPPPCFLLTTPGGASYYLLISQSTLLSQSHISLTWETPPSHSALSLPLPPTPSLSHTVEHRTYRAQGVTQVNLFKKRKLAACYDRHLHLLTSSLYLSLHLLPSFSLSVLFHSISCNFNGPSPASFIVYFQTFLQQTNVKNTYPLSGAGIRSRDLWITTRPVISPFFLSLSVSSFSVYLPICICLIFLNSGCSNWVCATLLLCIFVFFTSLTVYLSVFSMHLSIWLSVSSYVSQSLFPICPNTVIIVVFFDFTNWIFSTHKFYLLSVLYHET